jgi:hypothetical protein
MTPDNQKIKPVSKELISNIGEFNKVADTIIEHGNFMMSYKQEIMQLKHDLDKIKLRLIDIANNNK